MGSRNGIHKKSIPGDASDPAGLAALLHRYLVGAKKIVPRIGSFASFAGHSRS
jgi:hypothetical protein